MKRRRMLLLTTMMTLTLATSIGAQEIRIADCPHVVVSCPDSINGSSSVSFTATVTPVPNVKYVWTVSAGTITQGQGTATVTVAIRGDRTLTATVEVIGFPAPCPNTASCSIIGESLPQARKFDEYRLNCKPRTPPKAKRAKLSAPAK